MRQLLPQQDATCKCDGDRLHLLLQVTDQGTKQNRSQYSTPLVTGFQVEYKPLSAITSMLKAWINSKERKDDGPTAISKIIPNLMALTAPAAHRKVPGLRIGM